MRQLWLIGCAVVLLTSLSLAQEKLESQWKCGKASDDHSIDVGDKANHSYAVSKTTCTATKSEIGGTKEKEGIGTQFNEATGNATTWHGVFVVTAESGDKIHYHYTGKGMMKDGKFTSGTNKWTMMGGTGKFAKAKGEGTCAGKGDGADGATWECTGTYTMK
jgi:hypothetical protein